jgi:two-component system response regulator HydG
MNNLITFDCNPIHFVMEKRKGNLLIVDDNMQILNSLNLLLKTEFFKIELLKNPNQIPSILHSHEIDVVLLDMNFRSGDNSGNEGLFWLSEILKIDPLISVIMITAYGDIALAVRAIKEGAIDFISKPWDAEKLIITLRNAQEIRSSKKEVKSLKNRQQQLNLDIEKQFKLYRGDSRTMEVIFHTIDKVAQTHANILILGENGTGKEVIAREIHRRSKRSTEVFLSVDMGSISESLFESEMFGHMKGAFTDAKEDRIGRFEAATGGTLFLDEIGNLSMAMQSKLLGVLENKEITPLGSSRPVAVDFRLITATNKNVEEMVQKNLFREDLLFRINTIQLELPPLRERKEDIPGLADFFLAQFINKYEKPFLKMTGNAYEALIRHPWMGNIRELKHTIEKAVIMSDSAQLQPEDFNLRHTVPDPEMNNTSMNLSDMEKVSIIKVL